MTKNEIRDLMKAQRRSLTHGDVLLKSRAITEKITSLPDYINSKTVMCYISAFKEPETLGLIKSAVRSKRIVVPVSNTDTFTITPSALTSTDDLVRGAYGIYEPEHIIEIDINEIDAALIPGIAFDKNLNRLGFGKGYYDRFLAEFKGIKIGICYDFQITDTPLPADEFDVPMDMIITEKRIYR